MPHPQGCQRDDDDLLGNDPVKVNMDRQRSRATAIERMGEAGAGSGDTAGVDIAASQA